MYGWNGQFHKCWIWMDGTRQVGQCNEDVPPDGGAGVPDLFSGGRNIAFGGPPAFIRSIPQHTNTYKLYTLLNVGSLLSQPFLVGTWKFTKNILLSEKVRSIESWHHPNCTFLSFHWQLFIIYYLDPSWCNILEAREVLYEIKLPTHLDWEANNDKVI